MKHAPGPCSVDEAGEHLYIVDSSGNTAIAKVMVGRPDGRANADRIVQCWNAHDDLVKLVQEAEDADPDTHVLSRDWHKRAAAILRGPGSTT